MIDPKLRTVLMMARQALLLLVEAIETYLDVAPTTAQIRRQAKSGL